MPLAVPLIVWMLALGLGSALRAHGPRGQAPEEPRFDFERDVRGVFRASCVRCHGAGKESGGLRLDRRESLLGGDDPVVVAGAPAESELYRRLLATDPEERMPHEATALAEESIARIGAWIEAGAPWPDETRRAPHWAYVAPRESELPEVRSAAWCRNPVDRFVLARLERAGLAPSAEADRATLARRAALDLVGLPPAPSEIEAFERDTAPAAWERWVDHLLASPHYGEKEAQHWLDAARYADTNGYEKDERRAIWPWRDWVIAAFTADMGFDRFTVEQLAGDLLPDATRDQRVATGFQRNTLVNQEGGTDPEEFRVAAVVDRTNTMGSVWLGTTVACAQCHDHKYDPLSQREYFQLYAFFDQTKDTGNELDPALAVPTPAQEREQAELAERRRELERALAATPETLEAEERAWRDTQRDTLPPVPEWHVLRPASARASAGSTLTVLADGSVLASGPAPEREVYELSFEPGEAVTVRVLRIEALDDPGLPARGPGRAKNGDFLLSELEIGTPPGLAIAAAEADHERHEGGSFPLADALDGDPATGWAGGGAPKRRCAALFVFREPLEVDARRPLVVRLRHESAHAQHLLGRVRMSVTGDAALAERLTPPASSVWESASPIGVESTAAGLAATLGLEPGGALAAEWTQRPEWRDGRPIALPGTNVAHFLRRTLVCGAATPVRLSFGGDDGFRAWLDGELVAESPDWPGTLPAQMRVERTLAPGKHELLVKVVNSSGPGQSWFQLDRRTRDRLPEDVHSLLAAPDARWTPAEEARVRAFWRENLSARYAADQVELAALAVRAKTLAEAVARTPVLEERAERRVTRVHVKGSFLAPGEPVEPDVPAWLPPLAPRAGARAAGSPGAAADVLGPFSRLDLARWLVDPAHPLTARVVVNRYWERLFGRGLVATAGDFGARGEAPSHAELLDWLALDFVRHGWSVKHLLRTIVGSATYRQSSVQSPAARERDPENVFLARAPRLRLEIETVRDAALACGELLVPVIGGPSVMPPQPDAVWAPVYSGDAWKTETGPDRYRRGLYTFWRRSSPYATYMLFDAPSRELACTRRPRTNTPLQALALLNDPAFAECAAGLAERIAREGGAGVEERVRHGFRVCTGRNPSERETRVLRELFARELEALAHAARSGGVAAPAVPVHGPEELRSKLARVASLSDDPEHRAWTRVASVLLNLDETITRN